jgi:hypothetical protein
MDKLKSSIIKVYQIDGLQRKESEVDYRSTSWRRSDDLWESSEGWIPIDPQDVEVIREYTIKKLKAAQEKDQWLHLAPSTNDDEDQDAQNSHIEDDTQTEENPESLENINPEINQNQDQGIKKTNPLKGNNDRKEKPSLPFDSTEKTSWREAIIEQKKATLAEEQERSKNNDLEKLKRARELEYQSKLEFRKKWKKRVFLGLCLIACLVATIFFFVYEPKNKELFDQAANSENTNNSWNFFSANENTDSQISGSLKEHILKYTIEESIWNAKIRSAIYDEKTGQTKWEDIKDYIDFEASLAKVLKNMNAMHKKMKGYELSVNRNDLKLELETLRTLSQQQETDALTTISKVTRLGVPSLGTFPTKIVAQKAKKENWVSPLGALHEDLTGKSHQKRFIVSPTDPRSVGIPVKWTEEN